MSPRSGGTTSGRTILLFCLVLSVFGPAAAFGNSIVHLQAPPGAALPIEIKPQSSSTFVFRAVNRSGASVVCEPSVELPLGWRLLVPEAAYTLAPYEDSLRLVGIFVPPGTVAGIYKVLYRLTIGGSAAVEEAAALVRVPAEAALALRVVKSPDFVLAGDSFLAGFEVVNLGNSPAEITLSVQSPDGLQAAADWTTARLEAGEARGLGLTVKTDASLRRLLDGRITVTAAAAPPEAAPVRESAVSEVKVIPRVSGFDDYYRRIPVEFSAVGVYNPAARTGGQFRLEGIGTLDAAGRQTIDFLFRGPGLADMLNFGLQREEYRFSYESPGASIRLGDHVFSLTKLTESGRYGRGAGAEISPAGFVGLQAYYAESLEEMLVERRRQKAARLTLSPSEKLQFGVNYVGTKVDGAPEDRVFSLDGRWATKPLSLNAEYAVGVPSGGAADGSDRAVWLDAGARAGRAVFQGTYVDAGATFPGYYRNLLFYSAQAGWRPFGPVGLRAAYQDQRLGTPSTLFVSTLAEQSLLAGGQMDISPRIRFGLDYRRVDRRDLSTGRTFDYRDETVRLESFSFLGTLCARACVDVGRTLNFLTGRTARLWEFDASLSFEPVRGLRLGASADYRDQDRDFTGEKLNSLDLRLDTGLKWGGTRLEAHYQTSYRRDFTQQLTEETTLNDPFLLAHRLDMIEASLSHRFKNGQGVAIRFRGASPLDASLPGGSAFSHSMVSFEYTVPLHLPVGRRPHIGKISGRVLDAEMPGHGLANVLVKANDLVAVTDDMGRFVFHGVKPDTYYLNLDSKTVSDGRMCLQDAPLSVSIEGRAEKTVEIAVARSGGVEGRVVLVPMEEKDANRSAVAQGVGASGLAGTLVEARRDGTVYSQVTDDDGRFRFEDMRPGRWVLSIDSDDLPEFTYLEKSTIEIDVQPGLITEETVRVLPRRREIQFVDGGEIFVGRERQGGDLPTVPSSVEAGGTVLLQTELVSTSRQAENALRSIADICPTAKIHPIVSAGRTLYRVIISCPDAKSAENTLRILRDRGLDAAPAAPASRR